MADLYSTLGVAKDAPNKEIKSAYRKLAKKLHPDRNQDNPEIGERFKKVSAAYSVLGDEKARARYDRGEIDDNGNERGGFGGGAGSGFNRGQAGGNPFGFNMNDAEDLFSQFFSGGSSGPQGGWTGDQRTRQQKTRGPSSRKGMDVSYELTVGFEEAVKGGTRRMTLNDGRSIDMKIPAGTKNGQTIRLSGQGGPGMGGGKTGDALVRISVAAHPFYNRKDDDIFIEIPISVDEAILGGQIEIPTLKGRLTIKVPRGSSTGKRLRLRGKGVEGKKSTGDMYVTLKVMVPNKPDPDLVALIKQWHGGDGEEIRKKAGL